MGCLFQVKSWQEIQSTTKEKMSQNERTPGETKDILNLIKELYSKPADNINFNWEKLKVFPL